MLFTATFGLWFWSWSKFTLNSQKLEEITLIVQSKDCVITKYQNTVCKPKESDEKWALKLLI